MENKVINIGVVVEIAKALRDLREETVFVGGAVISLYTDDPAADEIRPTKDVDMTVNIASLSEWEKLQERLGELGFHPDPFAEHLCRYHYQSIPVDIMSTEPGPLGPTNPWYKIGFEDLWTVQALDQAVRILSPPCFLATKFEAYNDRGKDFRTSHDLEDIFYILDNRTTIVEEVEASDLRIKKFLKEELQKMIDSSILGEALVAHIHPLMREERIPLVTNKIYKIVSF